MGLPFFMIHPCHTSTLMARILSDVVDDLAVDSKGDASSTTSECKTTSSRRADHFLMTWLSTVAPVIGLPIHLSLVKMWFESQ